MTAVARLLPRHWDGRRLLQFLTGLALIALAFTLPALLSPGGQPVEAPVTVITTVDSPAPSGGLALGAADLTATGDVTSAAAATGADEQATAGTGVPGGLQAAGFAVVLQHGGRLVCADAAAGLGGATPRTRGERGPPRI